MPVAIVQKSAVNPGATSFVLPAAPTVGNVLLAFAQNIEGAPAAGWTLLYRFAAITDAVDPGFVLARFVQAGDGATHTPVVTTSAGSVQLFAYEISGGPATLVGLIESWAGDSPVFRDASVPAADAPASTSPSPTYTLTSGAAAARSFGALAIFVAWAGSRGTDPWLSVDGDTYGLTMDYNENWLDGGYGSNMVVASATRTAADAIPLNVLATLPVAYNPGGGGVYGFTTPPEGVLFFIGGPPEPPVGPGIITAEQFRPYWDIAIYDPITGNLIDLPRADIEEIDLTLQVNGGPASGRIVFRRPFNNIGAVSFLYRVLFWMWSGEQGRPNQPYWSGYMLEPDQEMLAPTGRLTMNLVGDAKQLDRGITDQDIFNPGVAGNPNMDAADLLRFMVSTYGPPGYLTYVNIPSAMFNMLPCQFSHVQLSQAIDTIIKSGRDDLGQLWTWYVTSNNALQRTLTVQRDQNPNKIFNVNFKNIFVKEMCQTYTLATQYKNIVNAVLIIGGNDPTSNLPVEAFFTDNDSIAAFGPFEAAVSNPSLLTRAALQNYALAFLDINANPTASGTAILHTPDPLITAGTWVRFWETPGVVKEVRIGQVNVTVKADRIDQELQPVAPIPYLDQAVYQLGQHVATTTANLLRQFPSSSGLSFVRAGGTVTSP